MNYILKQYDNDLLYFSMKNAKFMKNVATRSLNLT